jgi:hypothetical protein
VIYPALWVVDDARLPKWPQLALHLLMTAIAMVAVRVCVQSSLLHQEPDHQQSRPILCVHCERVVPDMPFCPACGAAARGFLAIRTPRTPAIVTRPAGGNTMQRRIVEGVGPYERA